MAFAESTSIVRVVCVQPRPPSFVCKSRTNNTNNVNNAKLHNQPSSVGLTDLVANGEWPLMACCWSKRRTFTMVHGTMSTGAVWCVLV